MGRLNQALDVVSNQIAAAITAAGITTPLQIYQGWPAPTELSEVLNQNQAAISLYSMPGGRVVTPRQIYIQKVTTNTPTLITAVSDETLTLSGTFVAGTVVYVYFTLGTVAEITSYRTVAGDTLASVATAIAGLLVAFPGVAATVSGSTVTATGISGLAATVLATGNIQQQSLRIQQRIQISVWSPSQMLCDSLVEAFLPYIGNDENPFIDLGDGSLGIRFRLASPPYTKDDAQSDFNVYESHTFYLMEYSALTNTPSTQVGEVIETCSLPSQTQTIVIGEQ